MENNEPLCVTPTLFMLINSNNNVMQAALFLFSSPHHYTTASVPSHHLLYILDYLLIYLCGAGWNIFEKKKKKVEWFVPLLIYHSFSANLPRLATKYLIGP